MIRPIPILSMLFVGGTTCMKYNNSLLNITIIFFTCLLLILTIFDPIIANSDNKDFHTIWGWAYYQGVGDATGANVDVVCPSESEVYTTTVDEYGYWDVVVTPAWPEGSEFTVYVNGTGSYDEWTGEKNDTVSDPPDTNVGTIMVNPPNQPPIAHNDTAITFEDVSVNIDVLSNDTDTDGTILPSTLTIIDESDNGSTIINTSNGNILYTPNFEFNGTDSFIYTVEDDDGAISNNATVTITVLGQNDPPVAVNDSYNINEDHTLSIDSPGVLNNDYDNDTILLSAQLETTTNHGFLTLYQNGSFVYEPELNFAGTDSFTYTAFDGVSLSNIATVTITVNPVNDQPIIFNPIPANNSDGLSTSLSELQINIQDVEGDDFWWEIETSPDIGSTDSGDYETNGTKALSVDNLKENTTYTWIVMASDFIRTNWTIQTYQFTTNAAPFYSNEQPLNNSKNVPIDLSNLSIIIEDPEGDDFNWWIKSSPSIPISSNSDNGTMDSNGTKQCEITDLLNYGKTYTWYVNSTDPAGSHDWTREWFTFTTEYQNFSPIITNPYPEDGSTDVDPDLIDQLSVIIQDPESDEFNWMIHTSPNNGSNNGNNEYNGTKYCMVNLEYNTTYTWYVNTTDPTGSNGWTNETFTFTTINENTPPHISSPIPTNNSLISIDQNTLQITITDPNNDLINWTIETTPNIGSTNGSNENGGIKTCPIQGLTPGERYTWFVNASDPTGTQQTTKDVYMFSVNHDPTIKNPIPPNNSLNVSLSTTQLQITIEDKEGNLINWEITCKDQTGSLIGYNSSTDDDNGTKTCSFSSLHDSTTYTWQVNATDPDGSNALNSTTFVFHTVGNIPPNAVNDTVSSEEDTSCWIDVLSNDNDVDGTLNASTVTLIAAPSYGNTFINSSTGEIRYIPGNNYYGSDQFTYTVDDNDDATSNIATVSISINPINDPPVAIDDAAICEQNSLVWIPVLDNDADVDGTIIPSSIEIISNPTHGNYNINISTGDIQYMPHNNYQGIDSFTYRVQDNSSAFSNIATVTITIGDQQSQIDVNQSEFDRGFPIRHAVDGDWAGAQSFSPTIDTLSSVELYLRKFGTPEFNLTVEIKTSNPINGTILETMTFSTEDINSSWTWLSVDFDDILVNSGTDYFIVCPPAPYGVTTSFGYEWGYAFGDQYDGGSFWFTRDGGALWRSLPTMYEFTFKTYGY